MRQVDLFAPGPPADLPRAPKKALPASYELPGGQAPIRRGDVVRTPLGLAEALCEPYWPMGARGHGFLLIKVRHMNHPGGFPTPWPICMVSRAGTSDGT